MVHCKHQYILKISLLGNGKRAKDATMAVANELLQMPPCYTALLLAMQPLPQAQTDCFRVNVESREGGPATPSRVFSASKKGGWSPPGM